MKINSLSYILLGALLMLTFGCNEETIGPRVVENKKNNSNLYNFESDLNFSKSLTFESLDSAILHPDSVYSLYLLDYKSDSFPIELKSFKNLQHLYIFSNEISVIPKWIEELNQLKSLDINLELLQDIPDELFELSNLEILHIGGGNLNFISENISKLKRLKDLWFSFNQLNSLPESFSELDSLVSLSIESNSLTEIPVTICNLKNLDRLKLYNNLIDSYPKEIRNLTNLSLLSIDHNRLTNSQLKELMELLPNCTIYPGDQFQQREKGLD